MVAESYLINADIVLRSEEEGAFLFDPDSGRICFVNDVGITIWKSCKMPVTLAEIIARVSLAYAEVPSEKVDSDCREFLRDLEKLGFLSITR